jgi:hypothetical protein
MLPDGAERSTGMVNIEAIFSWEFVECLIALLRRAVAVHGNRSKCWPAELQAACPSASTLQICRVLPHSMQESKCACGPDEMARYLRDGAHARRRSARRTLWQSAADVGEIVLKPSDWA